MNKSTFDAKTIIALRDLDPASSTVLSDAERERADASFARIVATPAHEQVPQEPGRPLRRRRRRLVVSAALVGVTSVTVPALLLGGSSALASWTPTPEPLTDAAAATAATACRSALEMSDQDERVVIAERRGKWAYVLLAGPSSEAACLMPNDVLDQQDPAAHTRDGFMGHYETTTGKAPNLARDDIAGTGGTNVVPTGGLWNFSAREEWVHYVEGYVGSDVTAVTVHTSVDEDVVASVANGRFAAWWPTAKRTSDNPEVDGKWTYTLTLADGSTRKAIR